MQHRLVRVHAAIFSWRHMWTEEVLALFLVLFVFIMPVSAAMRFQERSLYMNTSDPGATTFYKIGFRYMSPQPVGSVDLLFCVDPIPYHPCATPPGLDVSNATLTEQTGETGYSILTKTSNHIVLTRPPTMIGSASSTYTLENIRNPTDTSQSFSIRLRSHASVDTSGSQIDFGAVKGQVTDGIVIQTQVPPMLIFCVAGEVSENCVDTNENYYTDMGDLSPSTTLTAQSQMAVGTNASGGFAITANGTPPSAGLNIIEPLAAPTRSIQGSNQFGINLVANNEPVIGNDPEGTWANAVPSPEYSAANRYKYIAGDVVAFSPNVSLMKKFTISYIVNSSKDLRPGVYSTTITYIASGRF